MVRIAAVVQCFNSTFDPLPWNDTDIGYTLHKDIGYTSEKH